MLVLSVLIKEIVCIDLILRLGTCDSQITQFNKYLNFDLRDLQKHCAVDYDD